MTSPGEANVVPIALVLDGRTGFTLWAAPWMEDGEEWQAFLGAGSKVFVFEDLGDLETFLGSGAENDLSDHPSWAMLQTLPSAQLTPEADYYFDLDEVPGLTESDPDDEVVMRVGDTIDMVQRVAECCDDGALINLLDSPAFAALLDEEAGFDSDSDEEDEGEDEEEDDGDTGDGGDDDVRDSDAAPEDDLDEDNPWAEIGEAVRTSWPLVSGRVNGCLRWFAAGEQPERVAPDTDLVPAGASEPDAQASGGTDGLAGPTADRNAGSGGADPTAEGGATAVDEKAAQFWEETGVAPVLLVTSAGRGYTLRCYLDDEARFLGAEGHIEVFRSAAGLAAFARSERDHDLAELDSWPQVRGAESMLVTPAAEDSYDLGAAEAQLHAGPAEADQAVLRRACDFLLDAAEYCDLVGVAEALADEGELCQAIAAVLRPATGSMFSQTWNGSQAAALWRDTVAEVESALHWNE